MKDIFATNQNDKLEYPEEIDNTKYVVEPTQKQSFDDEYKKFEENLAPCRKMPCIING